MGILAVIFTALKKCDPICDISCNNYMTELVAVVRCPTLSSLNQLEFTICIRPQHLIGHLKLTHNIETSPSMIQTKDCSAMIELLHLRVLKTPQTLVKLGPYLFLHLGNFQNRWQLPRVWTWNVYLDYLKRNTPWTLL